MNKDKVAVIILNYQTWSDTLREAQCVHDLFGLKWEQIVIIDNNSPNESERILKENGLGNYVFIESKKNLGYAAGNNIGLRFAKSNGYKYGWILNNDIIFDKENVLQELLRILETDSTVGTVNPDIYSLDGYLYNRDSKRKNLYDFTFGLYKYKKIGREIKDVGGYGYIYRPQGCCMMVDLEKMEKIDYMDEHTFLYCEELILAERLMKHGWKCACAINTSVVHNHSKTVKNVLGKWKTLMEQNKSFNYYLKEYRKYGFLERIVCVVFFLFKNSLTN